MPNCGKLGEGQIDAALTLLREARCRRHRRRLCA
jgi:hypothetical protein